MTSRDTVLDRARTALAGQMPTIQAIPREYRRSGHSAPGSAEAVELLIDRLLDYKAHVIQTTTAGLPAAIDTALGSARSVVVPPGLEAFVINACGQNDRTVTTDLQPQPLTAGDLDAIDVVVTRARVAIALSGTIILDGEPDQGRRIITLVPDSHLVILNAEQVVATVPEAIHALDPTRPLTMIAGPSATSDIELERVEGVHGPRTFKVIIVDN